MGSGIHYKIAVRFIGEPHEVVSAFTDALSLCFPINAHCPLAFSPGQVLGSQDVFGKLSVDSLADHLRLLWGFKVLVRVADDIVGCH